MSRYVSPRKLEPKKKHQKTMNLWDAKSGHAHATTKYKKMRWQGFWGWDRRVNVNSSLRPDVLILF